MKKVFLPFIIPVLLFGSIHKRLMAQNRETIIREIDEQVWKPFVKSWEAFDAKTFNNLHTNDVLRVNKRGIKIGNQYKDGILAAFGQALERGDNRTIEFRFEERNVGPDIAYEVGYYKITAHGAGPEANDYYARFHVLMTKIEGKWKIAQDWDSNEINGVKISKADYEKGGK